MASRCLDLTRTPGMPFTLGSSGQNAFYLGSQVMPGGDFLCGLPGSSAQLWLWGACLCALRVGVWRLPVLLGLWAGGGAQSHPAPCGVRRFEQV